MATKPVITIAPAAKRTEAFFIELLNRFIILHSPLVEIH
jgi:hypothetical protein